MAVAEKVCMMVRKAPIGSNDALEAFRLSLGLFVADVEATVILVGDGVLNALRNLDGKEVKRPTPQEYLEAIADSGLSIWAVQEDLMTRGLSEAAVEDFVQIASWEQLAPRLEAEHLIWAF